MNYLLLNKSTPLLLFSCVRDEFDEVECRELEWYSDFRPLRYRNLTDMLAGRQAPKHRKHMEELLIRYGCRDLEGYLRVSHALSLNDTFWVKEEHSALLWENVSLYRNDFDKLVSHAAFDGRFSSATLSSTSPEFSTDGNFAKCWIRENERIMLYKSGSSTFEIEPLSEYLSCQVAQVLHMNHVHYDLDFYHGKLISKCELFTNENIGLLKAHDVLPRDKRSITSMLEYFTDIGSEDEFRRMCVLDALILNVDRHTGNFGVLVRNETQEILRMAPVFDNNRSLLFDMDGKQLENLGWCIRTCRPRIGTDFIATARGMLTNEIRQDLLTLTDFEFTQHTSFPADADRLRLLSALIRHQAGQILSSAQA